MISIDDHPPPDPSSSHHNHHHQPQIAHDLNVSDIDLKSPDVVDLHHADNHLPNFSIRDYVFGLRSKDIACNWPFSSTSLQLCLKHGVKNLLPPFQSLESRLHDDDEEENVISFNGKPRNDRVKSLVTVSTNSSGLKRDKESEFQVEEHVVVAHTRAKENIKKSKLAMKLNQGVEQVEEISMASKICPVCKIFSSSSNTTLNAHIDQCLTGDQGTMKWADNNPKVVVVKHRVKPRKTRLMVEIYKTAPHCTIEELDRRNGTNWATNSSFPAREFQFDHGDEEEEEEKEEARTITTVNRDNEGDVYIDTDGTKVRILSVPKDDHNHGDRKLLKGVKGSKFVMGKKKFKRDLHKQKHHKKYLKLIPNAKKLCSLKSQARNCEEDDDVNCSKDEQPRNPLADLAIVRPPWACSKRTNLAKRKHRKNLRIIESDKSSSRCDLGSPPLSSDDVAVSQIRKKTRTSSPLMAEFRKESSRMHDDDDDDDIGDSSDSSPSENSDDSFDTRSKVRGKLLKKNLSFKRKPSSVNYHSSSKENSRNEEHVIRKNNEEITSKSSNEEEEEEESSFGVETADVDALPNLDQDQNHDHDQDQVCVLQAPPNFTGLSNAFDPDFSKCVELYQEQLLSCSTNRAPEVEKHDFFFHEDDPIPIPGPPGSFLPPSPGGDMVVSDEQHLQANSSSTTTTRIPSTETHHNHDRDSMSNSPVSTVSNPSNLARSDSRSTSVVQDDHHHAINARAQGIISGFLVESIHTKSLTSFKNDPQPCCCSRKDAAFSYNQESSTIVRKQPIESTPIGFNFRSDTFPLSNYSVSQAPETAIFPVMKKSPDSTATPSKPVLRLMGKNLTVVKSDVNVEPFRPPQPPPVIFSQFQTGSNVYPPVSHGGFMAASVDNRYGHDGGYLGYTVPQAMAHHDRNSREIIIIDNDDLPENKLDDSTRRNRGQMNPLYTMYQGGGGGGGGSGGSMVFRGGGSFNGDLGKWDVGSSSPSRATSHMRASTSYYPPTYP